MSESADWFIDDEHVHAPGEGEVMYNAVPARSLAGTLVEATSGKDVARADVWLNVSGCTVAIHGRRGRFLAIWKPINGGDGALEVDVTVRADGYRAAAAHASFAANERAKRLALALEPLPQAGRGTLVLEAFDGRGRRLDGLLVADLTSAEEPSANARFVKTERVSPGRYRLEARAGRWRVSLHAPHVLSGLARAEANVVVDPGSETVARVDFPAVGSVRLRIPRGPDGKLLAAVLMMQSAVPRAGPAMGISDLTQETAGLAAGADLVLEAFPPGEWVLALTVVGGNPVERHVTVVEGEEATADFRE